MSESPFRVREIHHRMINLNEPYSVPPDEAKFSPGEVVRHLRYGYRGLIVDFDTTCQADDGWHKANQT